MALVKIILPARLIPEGARVTKRTGDKSYTILSRITVYDQSGGKREIPALDGSRFIEGDPGCCNSVSAEMELIWLVEEAELLEFLLSRSAP